MGLEAQDGQLEKTEAEIGKKQGAEQGQKNGNTHFSPGMKMQMPSDKVEVFLMKQVVEQVEAVAHFAKCGQGPDAQKAVSRRFRKDGSDHDEGAEKIDTAKADGAEKRAVQARPGQVVDRSEVADEPNGQEDESELEAGAGDPLHDCPLGPAFQ